MGVWYFSAELEENSVLNSKVWDASGVRGNGTFPLDYFSYNNSALLDVIFRHLEKTNFSGVTVSVGKEDGHNIFIVVVLIAIYITMVRMVMCLSWTLYFSSYAGSCSV